MKKLLIAAAAISVTFAACKKSDNGGDTGRAGILTSGNWKLTGLTLSFKSFFTGNDTTADGFSAIEACAQDDLYIFLSSKKVNVDQNVSKCDTSAPQQAESGTWAFNTAQDTLILDGVIPVGKYFKVVSFSNTSMQLQRDSSLLGTNIKAVATFTHQ